MDTMSTVPDRSGRSKARTRVRLLLRTLGDQDLCGHLPEQRTVTFAAFGARTVRSVTRAPVVVSWPRMRTVGNGRMTLRVADSCRTWPVVGTGVGDGAATSKVGAGVGTGVGATVATGVGTGVGVGAGV